MLRRVHHFHFPVWCLLCVCFYGNCARLAGWCGVVWVVVVAVVSLDCHFAVRFVFACGMYARESAIGGRYAKIRTRRRLHADYAESNRRESDCDCIFP